MKSKIISNYLLIAILTIATQHLSIACSCWGYQSVFCRAASENQHIIMAVVTHHIDESNMKVLILENLHKVINQDSLTIIGQDGANCGEYLEQFNVDDTLIMAMNEWLVGDSTSWYLDGYCGLHFLRFENGNVIGKITDSVFIQPIQEFKDNLLTCLAMPILSDKVVTYDNGLSISPNPVTDKFEISISSASINAYDIYNSSGQCIASKQVNLSVQTHEINIEYLNTGIYYIKIFTSNGILFRKFLKT